MTRRQHPIPKRRRKPSTRPKHKGRVTPVSFRPGEQRIMPSGWVARQLGRAKGGRMSHALGKAPKFDHASSLKALRRRWARILPWSGARAGTGDKRAPRVNRAGLRARYAQGSVSLPDGATIGYGEAGWWQEDSLGRRPLSERQALVRLGHVVAKTRGRRVPRAVGTTIAVRRKLED